MCSWKMVLPLGSCMSYMPLGPVKPRRVPCPPLSITAQTCPAAMASQPLANTTSLSSRDASMQLKMLSVGMWQMSAAPETAAPAPPLSLAAAK